jgi:hypothetical protein
VGNDLSSRQWRLDTPVPFSAGPAAIIWQSTLFVKQAEFSDYSAPTDECVLKDRTGRIVWKATGSVGMQPTRLGDIGWVNGLCLDTLDSGLCVVYIK